MTDTRPYLIIGIDPANFDVDTVTGAFPEYRVRLVAGFNGNVATLSGDYVEADADVPYWPTGLETDEPETEATPTVNFEAFYRDLPQAWRDAVDRADLLFRFVTYGDYVSLRRIAALAGVAPESSATKSAIFVLLDSGVITEQSPASGHYRRADGIHSNDMARQKIARHLLGIDLIEPTPNTERL